MVDYTNLTEILSWIVAGPGAIWLVQYALALLVENWAGWGKLPKFVKTLLPILAAVLLGIGGKLLLTVPDALAAVQPWFLLVATIVAGWIGSQQGYIKAKTSGYGERFSDSEG